MVGLTQKSHNYVITSDSDVFSEAVDHPKNAGIASLHCVSVAMTNLRCVSPEWIKAVKEELFNKQITDVET
ncbi:MAG: hypothetical protein SWZ49_31070 [Cyanobacteriota bacterium]|nr:hypothetical protein [Cyanobacteriota bacterium]